MNLFKLWPWRFSSDKVKEKKLRKVKKESPIIINFKFEYPEFHNDKWCSRNFNL